MPNVKSYSRGLFRLSIIGLVVFISLGMVIGVPHTVMTHDIDVDEDDMYHKVMLEGVVSEETDDIDTFVMYEELGEQEKEIVDTLRKGEQNEYEIDSSNPPEIFDSDLQRVEVVMSEQRSLVFSTDIRDREDVKFAQNVAKITVIIFGFGIGLVFSMISVHHLAKVGWIQIEDEMVSVNIFNK